MATSHPSDAGLARARIRAVDEDVAPSPITPDRLLEVARRVRPGLPAPPDVEYLNPTARRQRESAAARVDRAMAAARAARQTRGWP